MNLEAQVGGARRLRVENDGNLSPKEKSVKKAILMSGVNYSVRSYCLRTKSYPRCEPESHPT